MELSGISQPGDLAEHLGIKYQPIELPEINQDLFGRIDKQIEYEPEWFNMEHWELSNVYVDVLNTNQCGTQRCAAGWAIHMTHVDAFGETGKPLADMLADLTGEAPQTHPRAESDSYLEYAAALLGLTLSEANRLFYTNNRLAKELIHAYATGGRDAARVAQREYTRMVNGEIACTNAALYATEVPAQS